MGAEGLASLSFMLGEAATYGRDLRQVELRANVVARDLRKEFGAATVLLLSARDSRLVVAGADGLHQTEIKLLRAQIFFNERGGEQTLRGGCRWNHATLEDQTVEILVASLGMIENDEILVAAVFDLHIVESREAVEERLSQRRSLALSYLEMCRLVASQLERESALEHALSSIRSGIVLLDADANVVFSNAAADNILKAGNCLKVVRGRLTTTNLRDNVRMAVALQHVTEMSSEGTEQRAPLLVLERHNGVSLTLLALPLPPTGEAQRSAVTMLHIVDPELDFVEHVRPLCHTYELSRSETDLVCSLAKGLTLVQAAQAMRVKEQTARSFLRSIFSKTGTCRQTELLLQLLSRIAPTSSTLKIEAF